jgi:hypothetical protein
MTVINGIEIDFITYNPNPVREAIINNDPIEDKLHVIAVVSNPSLFATRYILMKEFMERMSRDEPDVILYVVELAYRDQKFLITDSKNKRHLQLRTECALWHKENLVNLAVRNLLPSNYKAFAWVDGDIEFESPTWATDALRILNGSKDIVQLFSHGMDMDKNENTMMVFQSAGFKLVKNGKYCAERGLNYSHPGYAWAITRKAFERVGGLYEHGILGSGDYVMLLCLLGRGNKFINSRYNADFVDSVMRFQEKFCKLRFGYVPGVIRHYFHGSKTNRKYQDRNEILIRHQYSPYRHLAYDASGILIPTNDFPEKCKEEIMEYFNGRKEDE